MRQGPVLVVGTTPDYVAKIYKRYPATAIFILDAQFEKHPLLEDVSTSSLMFDSLTDFHTTYGTVRRFFASHEVSAQGVACFDCESLILASRLALHLGRRFPPEKAIARTRNKFEAKRTWKQAGIQTPDGIIAADLTDTLAFFNCSMRDIVLKPISASGSELAFHCVNERDVEKSVQVLKQELAHRRLRPLFQTRAVSPEADVSDFRTAWIVEEYVSGPEYSCDFLMQDGSINILRETGKVKAPDQTFGSILAYTYPAKYPPGFSKQRLLSVLSEAAESLGFDWGHFMVDFIVQNGLPVLLEMTPRPGGDSIPDLVDAATGRDLLGVHLDFVSGRFRGWQAHNLTPESFASINFFALNEGVIAELDLSEIEAMPYVLNIHLKKKVGDAVTLPPRDYDHRLLGYCVMTTEPGIDLVARYMEIKRALRVSISPFCPQKASNQTP
jgi:biotin carboxylase